MVPIPELPPAVAKSCNDCPWRKDSIPGWLGPYDARRWLEIVHSDEPIACHMTIKESGSWTGAFQCKGAAIYRANVAKVPREDDVATATADRLTVFANPQEFREHHG